MIARRLPKARWGLLAPAVVAAAVAAWWLLTPASLTPTEQALVGTWAMRETEHDLARLTFQPDRSVVQTIFDNGPNTPPRVHHFRWWVEGDSLVLDDELGGSLFDRATRPLRPQAPKLALVSV